MGQMFLIEDERHAEPQTGQFMTFEEAIERLKVISKIPWDKAPNKCPCSNWRECERYYQIVEYKSTETPWTELQRVDILSISAKGVKLSRPEIGLHELTCKRYEKIR